ncbi:hypothetical protein [Shewanella algicola]|uniref:Uncharacterized protein n=1 Tax=Shewanella algicola TaxID=640633 RepID=A0A9X1Z345_9GAMM|nr:hypothetical protein [Shewanella algicola]MCL1104205.1 hypothetical protein [Shewanella algicola]
MLLSTVNRPYFSWLLIYTAQTNHNRVINGGFNCLFGQTSLSQSLLGSRNPMAFIDVIISQSNGIMLVVLIAVCFARTGLALSLAHQNDVTFAWFQNKKVAARNKRNHDFSTDGFIY